MLNNKELVEEVVLVQEEEEALFVCPVDKGEECTNCLYCIGM